MMNQTMRTTWLEMQKKGVVLESICVGSANICVLPLQDSKCFDGIDETWKETMKESALDGSWLRIA